MTSRYATFYNSGVSGALLAPLKCLLYALMLLLALILAAWIVDWVFVFRVWPDGIERLQAIFMEEFARTLTLNPEHYDVTRWAIKGANLLYDAIFGITGIHHMGSRFADSAALSIPDTIMRNTYVANYEAIRVAMVGTQLFGLRLAVLLAFSPLLVLTYAVSIGDGLAQRSVRRASGGNESANIYHRAKYLQLMLGSVSGALYLLWPASIDPRGVFFVSIGLLIFFARWQAVYYKKHL